MTASGPLWSEVELKSGLFSDIILNLFSEPVVGLAKMPLHRLFRSLWIEGSKGLNDRLVLGNLLPSRTHVFKVLSELEA